MKWAFHLRHHQYTTSHLLNVLRRALVRAGPAGGRQRGERERERRSTHLKSALDHFLSPINLLLLLLFLLLSPSVQTIQNISFLYPPHSFLQVLTSWYLLQFHLFWGEEQFSLPLSFSSLLHSVSHLVGTHKPEGLSSSLSFWPSSLSSFWPSSLFLYLSSFSPSPIFLVPPFY